MCIAAVATAAARSAVQTDVTKSQRDLSPSAAWLSLTSVRYECNQPPTNVRVSGDELFWCGGGRIFVADKASLGTVCKSEAAVGRSTLALTSVSGAAIRGLAVDHEHIYAITAAIEGHVEVFRRSDRGFVSQFGPRRDLGDVPVDIVVGNRFVYVAYQLAPAIRVFRKADATLISDLASVSVASDLQSPHKLTSVNFMAGDAENLFVTTAQTPRLLMVRKSDGAVREIGPIANPTTELQQIESAAGIATDAHHLYVADVGRHAVCVAGKTDGKLLQTMSLVDPRARCSDSPLLMGLASDDCYVYVADFNQRCIHVLKKRTSEATTVFAQRPLISAKVGRW